MVGECKLKDYLTPLPEVLCCPAGENKVRTFHRRYPRACVSWQVRAQAGNLGKQLLGRLPPPVRRASSHYQLLQQKTPQMDHILALPLHFIEIKHSKGMEMRTIHSKVILLKVLILMGNEPHPCGDKGTLNTLGSCYRGRDEKVSIQCFSFFRRSHCIHSSGSGPS